MRVKMANKNIMAIEKRGLLPIDTYRKNMDTVPIATVDILFLNKTKDKTLLFRRINEPLSGIYYSIGGAIFKEETLLDCAVRQAKRELGLTINPNGLLFAGAQEEIHPNSIFPNISYHAIDIYYGYLLEDENIPLSLDKQHSDYKWFSVEDATLHPFMKTKLKNLLKIYGQEL